MSMIPIKELDAICEQQAGGVTPFGHTQVDDAVQAVSDMLYQELRQFAEKLKKANPSQAAELIDLLIAAGVTVPDLERHERIYRRIREAMTAPGDDEETELADERRVEQSNRMALMDEEDYYGQRLPASAQ